MTHCLRQWASSYLAFCTVFCSHYTPAFIEFVLVPVPGYQAVFQAEISTAVGTAYLATTARHPIWMPYLQIVTDNQGMGCSNPANATGPKAISTALKVIGKVVK